MPWQLIQLYLYKLKKYFLGCKEMPGRSVLDMRKQYFRKLGLQSYTPCQKLAHSCRRQVSNDGVDIMPKGRWRMQYTCLASGVAYASRRSLILVALRKSTNKRGGSMASGEGPTFCSALYREGGLARGWRTCVCLPSGSSAEDLHAHATNQGRQFER